MTEMVNNQVLSRLIKEWECIIGKKISSDHLSRTVFPLLECAENNSTVLMSASFNLRIPPHLAVG